MPDGIGLGIGRGEFVALLTRIRMQDLTLDLAARLPPSPQREERAAERRLPVLRSPGVDTSPRCAAA